MAGTPGVPAIFFLKTDYKMLKNSFFTYNIMYDIIT